MISVAKPRAGHLRAAQLEAFRQERAQWVVERETLRQGKHDDRQDIARLGLLLDKLRRMLFGQKSEKLIVQIDQLQLELEERHINQGVRAQQVEAAQLPALRPAPQRVGPYLSTCRARRMSTCPRSLPAPIARSFAGPGLLSHVMVSKYLDHQPLYRQCQIYEREDVSLAESTVGDWVGGIHAQTHLRHYTGIL